MYSSNYFPPYLAGYFYLIAQSVTGELLKQAQSTDLFHMEDVFVTGILRRSASLSIKDHHLLMQYPGSLECIIQGLIAVDNMPSHKFREFVEFLKKPNKCSTLNEYWTKHLYKIVYLLFEPLIFLSTYLRFGFKEISYSIFGMLADIF